jgi:hypothetical protein
MSKPAGNSPLLMGNGCDARDASPSLAESRVVECQSDAKRERCFDATNTTQTLGVDG